MSAPAYRAYSVIKREGKEDYWLHLGVAFKHEDGEGLNILLQGMPLDGKLVLRTYKELAEDQEKAFHFFNSRTLRGRSTTAGPLRPPRDGQRTKRRARE